MEDFLAQDFEGTTAEEFGAPFAEERFIGSPDA
jgi:hypothetical protein